MKQRPTGRQSTSEKIIRDIKRRTRPALTGFVSAFSHNRRKHIAHVHRH
jgi:hypothetical protein